MERGKETAVILSEREYWAPCGVREPLGTYLFGTAPTGIESELCDRNDSILTPLSVLVIGEIRQRTTPIAGTPKSHRAREVA